MNTDGSTSPTKPHRFLRDSLPSFVTISIYVVVMCGVLYLALPSVVLFFLTSVLPLVFGDEGWTLDRVQDALGVTLPAGATDVKFSGVRVSYTDLNLSFNASSSDVENFVRHLCPEGLHPHYDPFNAINVGYSSQYPFAVKIAYPGREPYYYDSFSYESLSPNAEATTYGVRCIARFPYGYNIRVDRANREVASMWLTLASIPYGTWNDLYDRKPITDFPLLVRGLVKDGRNQYAVYMAEICFEIDPLASSEMNNLKHASVKMTLNSVPLPDARVGDDGLLTPVSDNQLPDVHRYFSYCLNKGWKKGLNNLAIAVTTASGAIIQREWSFTSG